MKLWVTLDELVSLLGAMNPVLVFSENSYVENLMPKVMVLGGGIIGKWLGYEGRAPMNEISVLLKEAWNTRSSLLSRGGKNICVLEEALT